MPISVIRQIHDDRIVQHRSITLGHSISLSLAALGWIHIPSTPVDVLIALLKEVNRQGVSILLI